MCGCVGVCKGEERGAIKGFRCGFARMRRLHNACRKGNVKEVKLLLLKGERRSDSKDVQQADNFVSDICLHVVEHLCVNERDPEIERNARTEMAMRFMWLTAGVDVTALCVLAWPQCGGPVTAR